MNEIMKNPLTAMKFNELKKKIQLAIHSGEKALSIDKKWKYCIFDHFNQIVIIKLEIE